MTKIKALNIMVKKLCKKEKGKNQINAGQAREILKCFADLFIKDDDFYDCFNDYIFTFGGNKK